MDLERSRKQAKALVRAVRSGDPDALARAQRVLGARAPERFVLADAQHVVAREQGARSWRELRAGTASGSEPQALRAEGDGPGAGAAGASGSEPQAPPAAVQTGSYRDGAPVVVRVRRRGHWVEIDDDGAAVALAGTPRGWLAVAAEVVRETALNVNRRGVVFVRVHERRDLDELVARVGATSRALYGALLELDGRGEAAQ